MSVRGIIGGLVAAALASAPGTARAGLVQPSKEALMEAGDRFDFPLWSELLGRYVDGEGRVDYARLAATPEDLRKLDRLYAQVGRQSLGALLSDRAREAFLINAYNVCVWKNVVARYPYQDLASRIKQAGFFGFTRFLVAGKKQSLKSLEDDGVRKRFGDPRVHMALNCASGGCPLLPREAFDPLQLDAQLEREARRFCNEERNVAYDPAAKQVKLSKIFDWYSKDFGGRPLDFINRYRDPERQIPAGAKVQFVDYDWRVNDTRLTRP